MIAAIALWLPLPALFRMILLMSIAGGVVTLVMVIGHRLRRAKTVAGGDSEAPGIEVPYGVAIAIAALLVLREPIFNPFQHT
jgi:prepilin peptidase CpaA